jgi:hypothetical protein
MPDYNCGKIYKIMGNGLTYVGSTTETLPKRLHRHRCYVKDNKYCSSSKVINGDEIIELIELFPCNNKQELITREQYWLDNIENCNDKNALYVIDYKKKYANWKQNNPEAYKNHIAKIKCKRNER